MPKGTRQIQFYYFNGYSTGDKIRNYDQKVMAEISGARGDIHTIPVEAGMDGLPWSIGRYALGRMYFFNIPNYLSASPNVLLVPREAATADKLTILK